MSNGRDLRDVGRAGDPRCGGSMPLRGVALPYGPGPGGSYEHPPGPPNMPHNMQGSQNYRGGGWR